MTIQKFEVPDWIRSVLICDPTDIWGNVVGTGLNELIACLTPAKRFDRRGSVFLIDSFENGLSQVQTATLGVGASVSISSDYSKFGGLAAHLVAGSGVAGTAELLYYLTPPPKSKMGVEVAVALNGDIGIIELHNEFYDGALYHYGRIRYDTINDKWQYYDHDLTWQDLLTGVALREYFLVFNAFKLVIDPVTDYYVRALVSGQDIDMSAYPLPTSESSLSHMVIGHLTVYSEVGKNGEAYVDSVVITYNEPANVV